MSKKEIVYYALLRESFPMFVRRVFKTVSPDAELIWGEYLDALSYGVQQVIEGKNNRLLVTLPPRYMKSIILSVALPAYLLGHNPKTQIICVSYAKELTLKHAADTNLVMQSDWYKKAFPKTALNLTQNTQMKLVTAENGYRLGTTVGGSLTGLGCNFLIIDDPHKAEEASSDALRNKTVDWYYQTASTRLNNKKKDAIIAVHQRLHQGDLAGHLIDQGGWHHLSFPAIAENEEKIPVNDKDYFHRMPGEALHPEREPLEDLEKRKYEMGEYPFASQYQQRPSPLGGGIIKLEWFEHYHKLKHPMHAEYTVQTWDTAVTASEKSDYTVCITAHVAEGKIHIKDILRIKMEFPELKDLIFQHAQKFNSDVVLIEAVGAGKGLYQQVFNQRLKMDPPPFDLIPDIPKDDKSTRLLSVSHIVGQGRVYLPTKAPWLDDFEKELLNFPNGLHDDQVDAFSLLLFWAFHRYLDQFV